MNRALLIAPLALALVTGCAAKLPPPGWQQGGAPLLVPRATWNVPPASAYQGYIAIELLQDGRVLENGAPAFGIDRAGRVYDLDGHPVALLRPDGRLIGVDNEDLGWVGPVSAALPGAKYAELGIAPNGQVIKYTQDGDMTAVGSWAGCGGFAPALQACMLVTYMAATKFPPYQPVNRYPGSPYGYGPYGSGIVPGFGLGIP